MRFPMFRTMLVVAALTIVVPLGAYAAGVTIDRDFIADQPRLLNESPLKRPGTVRSRRIVAVVAGLPIDVTPLTRGTEVMIKNYTAVGICLSFIGPTEKCNALADLCTGTAHDFIKAGESASYPLPRGPRAEDGFGQVCVDVTANVALNPAVNIGQGIFVTARN